MAATRKNTAKVGNIVIDAQAWRHIVQRPPVIQLQQFGYRENEHAKPPEHPDDVVAATVLKAAVCPVEEQHPGQGGEIDQYRKHHGLPLGNVIVFADGKQLDEHAHKAHGKQEVIVGDGCLKGGKRLRNHSVLSFFGSCCDRALSVGRNDAPQTMGQVTAYLM